MVDLHSSLTHTLPKHTHTHIHTYAHTARIYTYKHTYTYTYTSHTHIHRHIHICAQSLQSRPTICDPMSILLGSLVHGIIMARLLEWVPTASSRRSSRPRDGTWVSCGSCIGRWILYHEVTWEVHMHINTHRYGHIHISIHTYNTHTHISYTHTHIPTLLWHHELGIGKPSSPHSADGLCPWLAVAVWTQAGPKLLSRPGHRRRPIRPGFSTMEAGQWASWAVLGALGEADSSIWENAVGTGYKG